MYENESDFCLQRLQRVGAICVFVNAELLTYLEYYSHVVLSQRKKERVHESGIVRKNQNFVLDTKYLPNVLSLQQLNALVNNEVSCSFCGIL